MQAVCACRPARTCVCARFLDYDVDTLFKNLSASHFAAAPVHTKLEHINVKHRAGYRASSVHRLEAVGLLDCVSVALRY